MFIYPKYDKNGKKTVSRVYGKTSDMLMNISLFKLKQGDTLQLYEAEMETALLLLSGKITFVYEDKEEAASRSGVFTAPPVCLHICKEVAVTVCAQEDSEILQQSTYNDRSFPSKLYREGDIKKFVSCEGRWENTAVRDVVDIINIRNSPYSNMVIGEVYARQGRWWSFIPHDHPQPEVYYYKFDRPEGFGACFIGEKAYTIKDGSAGLFKGGYTHAQVTAPGYPMYCCWMIRHLDGNPWDNTRTDDPRYQWLLQQ